MNSPERIYGLRLSNADLTIDHRKFMPKVSKIKNVLILLLSAALLSGCRTQSIPSAPAANYYYRNPDKYLTNIGRVAIIELDNDSSYPQISTDISGSLYQSLQKRQVFGLTLVRLNDPSWRSLQIQHDSAYTLEKLLAIRDTLKCDGILLGTVTEYRPFPHMAVGLRLKLLDLRDGQLVWALEQVWDSDDKATEKRTRDYFKSEKREGFAPLNEKLAAVSPIEFLKFVSYEVARTF